MKGDKSLATELALWKRVKATFGRADFPAIIEYRRRNGYNEKISLISMKAGYLCRNVAEDDFSKRYRKQRICKQS